jgi:hypothetical protein
MTCAKARRPPRSTLTWRGHTARDRRVLLEASEETTKSVRAVMLRAAVTERAAHDVGSRTVGTAPIRRGPFELVCSECLECCDLAL